MEGIKIDVKSAIAGACAGALLGGVVAFVVCRRSFTAKLNAELAATRHHYLLRAAAAEDDDEDDYAVERPVPTLADYLGQPGVSVGFHDPIPGDVEHISWISPEDLVVETAKVAEEHLVAISESAIRLAEDLGVDPALLDGISDESDVEDDGDSNLVEDSGAWPPAERDRAQPYIISEAEFVEGVERNGHQAISIKWFDEDKTLVDDRDSPIPDVRRTVGEISKSTFGGISGDPNIMYVRNEKLEVDFEIAYDPRSYTEGILNYGNPNQRKRR